MTNVNNDQNSVSVIIPVKNGEKTLAELLAMLSIQNVSVKEILITDSGSTDNSVAIAEKYGAQVFTIDPEDFDHGGTRSFLAKKAKGELLVFFTQDVLPRRKDTLEKIIAPLIKDKNIAASYGRQFPSFDADYFAEGLRNFNYTENSYVNNLESSKELGLKAAFLSNSFSCFRKSHLESIHFFEKNLIFGEDTVAAGKLLLNGYKIAYVAEAGVYHSHNYSIEEEFKRYFDIGVLHQKEKWLLEKFGKAEGQGLNYVKKEVKALFKNGNYLLLPELFVRIIMKYIGYSLGRWYTHLPKRLVVSISMNNLWWQSEKKL